MHQDFDNMTDEEIALLAQQGDADASEYLLNKYKNFVRSKARSYFLVGADHEDIVQEGMIGLFKAFRDFRPDKLASFHAFAEICVTRQIITAIKTATRQKHIPLNSYVSLNKPIYEEESDRTLLDVITEGRSADPEELLIGRESYVSIESRIDEALSPLERRVLAAYLDGKSYQEIAQMLDRHVKSIDNALLHCLGLSLPADDDSVDLREEEAEIVRINDQLSQLDRAEATAVDALERELEVYKRLYAELLDRVLKSA